MRQDSLCSGRHAIGEARLLMLLGRNLLIGAGVAVAVVAALLATDSHGLLGLVRNDSDPLIAVMLLTVGFVVTFGSAAMGAAVMLLPREDGNGSGGRPAPMSPSLRPALARAGARRGRAAT